MTADVVGLLAATPVGDVLLRADWWLLNSPAGPALSSLARAVLSCPWGVTALCALGVAAAKAATWLVARRGRIAAATRTGVANAALTVACLAGVHRVPAPRPADHHEMA